MYSTRFRRGPRRHASRLRLLFLPLTNVLPFGPTVAGRVADASTRVNTAPGKLRQDGRGQPELDRLAPDRRQAVKKEEAEPPADLDRQEV